MDLLLQSCCAFLLGALFGPEYGLSLITPVLLTTVAAIAWHVRLRGYRRALPLLCAALGLFLARAAIPRTERVPAAISGEITDISRRAEETRIEIRSGEKMYSARLSYGAHVELGESRQVRGMPEPVRDTDDVLQRAAHGISGVLGRAQAGPILEHGAHSRLEDLRRWIEARYPAAHPGDPGGLLAGLITGGHSALSRGAQNAFQQTGLAHVVAVSGTNFSLLLGFAARLLRRSPRRLRSGVLVGIAGAFWILVGGGASVARAGVTALAGILAEASGRRSGGVRALILSATVLTLFSPLAPRADASFQLSVLATAGVLLAGKIVRGKDPGLFGWKETLTITCCTMLSTLPVQLVTFERVSLVGPLANLLVVPLVPAGMAIGALDLSLGWFPGLGLIVHGLTRLLLGFMLSATLACAALPFASTALPPLPQTAKAPVMLVGAVLSFGLLLRRPSRYNRATPQIGQAV